MAKLKRIGVLSSAKIQGIMTFFTGIIFGTIFAIVKALTSSTRLEAVITFTVMIVIFPIIYSIFGFVLGAICAFFYNAVAKRTGGMEMEFEK